MFQYEAEPDIGSRNMHFEDGFCNGFVTSVNQNMKKHEYVHKIRV